MRLVTVRRLLAGSAAALSLAALPAAANADTGSFALPAGDAFTLTNTYVWACDTDSYGYKIGSQPRVVLGDNSASPCDQVNQPSVTVGPFTTAKTFTLFLSDAFTTPADRFFSDNANHTTITGTKGDWQIQIGDSDFGTAPPSVVYHAHNLSTTLTIAPAS
jgi:hypothetical protein